MVKDILTTGTVSDVDIAKVDDNMGTCLKYIFVITMRSLFPSSFFKFHDHFISILCSIDANND